jgi:hypothetical protein
MHHGNGKNKTKGEVERGWYVGHRASYLNSTFIREVPGSNLGLYTDYPDSDLPCFPSILPGKC